MSKKFQYVVKELNQPSTKAVEDFHRAILPAVRELISSTTKQHDTQKEKGL